MFYKITLNYKKVINNNIFPELNHDTKRMRNFHLFYSNRKKITNVNFTRFVSRVHSYLAEYISLSEIQFWKKYICCALHPAKAI